MSYSVNYESVCRTASVTPGLLTIVQFVLAYFLLIFSADNYCNESYTDLLIDCTLNLI